MPLSSFDVVSAPCLFWASHFKCNALSCDLCKLQRTQHYHHRPHDQQQQPQHFCKQFQLFRCLNMTLSYTSVPSNWDPCKCAWHSFAGVLDSRRKWIRKCGMHKLALNGMPVPKWKKRQSATCRAWFMISWFYDLSVFHVFHVFHVFRIISL